MRQILSGSKFPSPLTKLSVLQYCCINGLTILQHRVHSLKKKMGLVFVWFVSALVCVNAFNPFHVEWLTPTPEPGLSLGKRATYQGSMPFGNGVLTGQVWANVSAGGVQFYVGRQDAMGKDTALYKLGMVYVQLTPNVLNGAQYFNQSLDMRTGVFTLLAGGTNFQNFVVQFKLYADALSNVIFLDIVSPQGTQFDAKVEITSARPEHTFEYMPPFFCSNFTVSPDVYVESVPMTSLAMYHRNQESDTDAMEVALKQQSLEELLPQLKNHWKDLTFGFSVVPRQGAFKRVSPRLMTSASAQSSFSFVIRTESFQVPTVDAFIPRLFVPSPENFPRHVEFWNAFWDRSYMLVNRSQESDVSNEINQKYIMTRYLHSIQSRTLWPIKFNGMAFVSHMVNDDVTKGPDYRDWGPSNWWQNTRFPYWTMLPNGDFDLFETILVYFEQMIPFASYRTQKFWNHTGIYFIETKTLFGSYSPSDYGCTRPADFPLGYATNSFQRFDFAGNAGGPEVSIMLLDHYMYTQDEAHLMRFLPIATLTVEFFYNHYANRTDDGKYVFWPTQALETFWCGWPATAENCPNNDHPTVASMYALTERLLALPERLTTPEQRSLWTKFKALLPPLPKTPDGKMYDAAAYYVHHKDNTETPELYSVHPYRLFTLGKKITSDVSLDLSINSFFANEFAYSYNEGWNYGILNAAFLGLSNVTERMILERTTMPPPPGYRFSGFAPHIQDFEPSADHYAVYNSALNWMLMQPADDAKDSIVLFPAWPCHWDASFKMYGPRNTIVEVDYVSGELKSNFPHPNKQTFGRPSNFPHPGIFSQKRTKTAKIHIHQHQL
jgi:hypothetical protein